ncbi:MAG: response regulator [Rubrivivax sp.]|nr:response regulator [Rubrivivax sp.]
MAAQCDGEPPGGMAPAQWFLFIGAALCAVAAGVLAWCPMPLTPDMRNVLVAGCLVVGTCYAVLGRWRGGASPERRMLPAVLLGMVLVHGIALGVGQGLRTIALGATPVMVCLLALLAGRREAVAACVAALLCVVASYLVESAGWIDSRQGLAATPLVDDLIAHLVLLLGALVWGLLIAHAVQRWQQAMRRRERALAELLGFAADRYWELDAELRFSRPTVNVPLSAGELPPAFIGRHPWETPGLELPPAERDAHVAALRAHQPFELVVRSQPDADGRSEQLAISGRPRFDQDGRFIGYWGVGRDVTAEQERRAALAAARDAAEAASRTKSAFLANVSHEIRTPLNGLVGLAQLARQPGLDAVRRDEYLDLLGDSAAALTAVISDILDLAKIEAGHLQVRLSDFDLGELLRSLQRAYGALCEAQGLRLVFHAAADLPARVHGDGARLRQVLTNYLNNALKFGARGSVTLAVRRCSGDRLRFEVADEGPGIPLPEQARLFQPFTQLDAERARRTGGTGLGLAICRELAGLMQGEVGVVSVPRAGARFWIELPLPAAAPHTDAAPAAPAAAAATLADDGRLAGARVLLAEDNEVNRLIGQALLAQWSVESTAVTDGRAALAEVEAAAARGQPFDLVLMDIHMPELDGLAATRALRQRWPREALPIVALTAAVLEGERQEAEAAGMDAFLAKPVEAAHLREVLWRCLHRRAPAGRPAAETISLPP